MSKISRRKTAAPGDEPDAELLRLNAEYRTFMDGLNAGKYNDEKGDIPAEASARWDSLEKKIADTPAETYAGIAIKLRIAVDNFPPLDPGEPRITDLLNIESALADAERLAGSDTELLALEAQIVGEHADWKAGKVKDDEAEEHGERVSDMDQRFAEMPVHTLSGVAAKLRHLRYLLVDDGTLRTGDISLVETALAAIERVNKAGRAS